MDERGLHPDTRALLATWRRLNMPSGGAGAASWPGPERSGPILNRLFLLERIGAGAMFRMAGPDLCAMIGRNPVPSLFSTLFAAESASLIAAFVELVGGGGAPGLVRARMGDEGECEITLAPLPAPSGAGLGRRLIGLAQPVHSKRPGGSQFASGPWRAFALYPPQAQPAPRLRLVARNDRPLRE